MTLEVGRSLAESGGIGLQLFGFLDQKFDPFTALEHSLEVLNHDFNSSIDLIVDLREFVDFSAC